MPYSKIKLTRLESVLAFLWLVTIAAACRYSANPEIPEPTVTNSTSPAQQKTILTFTPAPSATTTPTVNPTSSSLAQRGTSPTVLPSQSPTETPTQTLTPTYSTLRGEVLVRSNCRYGPGAPYLYKYGLVAGSNLEVIGRTDRGTWILVRAIGGDNPCWVKASLMGVKGGVMSLQPTYIPLPPSPYYGPLKGVSARRDGDTVTVFWSPLSLRAGDDSEQVPYVIEAWVCTGGELVFTPVGAYSVAAEILDEPGCNEPSHGRITAAEKHGYTPFVEIPWP